MSLGTIHGYGWTWDVPVNRGGSSISIKRGAFRESVRAARKAGLPLLWSHDEERIPVGVITELEEDDVGLRFKAKLNMTREALDVAIAMESGAVRAPSISFGLDDAEYKTDQKTNAITFSRATLREISAVNFPAHPAASMWLEKPDTTTNPPAAGDQGDLP